MPDHAKKRQEGKCGRDQGHKASTKHQLSEICCFKCPNLMQQHHMLVEMGSCKLSLWHCLVARGAKYFVSSSQLLIASGRRKQLENCKFPSGCYSFHAQFKVLLLTYQALHGLRPGYWKKPLFHCHPSHTPLLRVGTFPYPSSRTASLCGYRAQGLLCCSPPLCLCMAPSLLAFCWCAKTELFR